MRAAQIKERLTLREVAAMVSIDLPKDDVKFQSPFRSDKNPSCSINGDLFTDWSSGEHLDSIGFFAAAKNISNAAAIRELRLQSSGEANRPLIVRPRKPPELPESRVEAPNPMEPSLDLIQQAAKSRGLSVEAFEHARMNLGTLSYNRIHGQKCWVLSDAKKIGWEARRCDGRSFDALGNLQVRKSHSKGRGLKKWPLGILPPGVPSIRIALKKPPILLVEGTPDYVAACELILPLAPRLVIPCAMLGKSADISSDALQHFEGRRVSIAGHPDARDRVVAWAKQIRDAKAASVHAVVLNNDLNDLLRMAPNNAEELRTLLKIDQ
jgi:hypothetical protein